MILNPTSKVDKPLPSRNGILVTIKHKCYDKILPQLDAFVFGPEHYGWIDHNLFKVKAADMFIQIKHILNVIFCHSMFN